MRVPQPRKQAKILTEAQLRALLDFAGAGIHPLRDQAMILLTFKAGLRAAEVAELDWSTMTDARGRLRHDLFEVVGKGKRQRTVPLHPELRQALQALRKQGITATLSRVIVAARGGAMSANNVTVHLWHLYRAAGLKGASSHSGRRTMITVLARRANRFGCSLKDVQILAGHANIETTQLYVEPSKEIDRLVRSL